MRDLVAEAPNAIIVGELGRLGLVAPCNTSDGRDIPLVSALAVHPAYRKLGIGAMMLEASVDIHAIRADAQDEVIPDKPTTSELLTNLPKHIVDLVIEWLNSNHREKHLADFYEGEGFKFVDACMIWEKQHGPPLSFMPMRGRRNRPSVNDSLALIHAAYCDWKDKEKIPSQQAYRQYGISQMNATLGSSIDPFLRDIQIPYDRDPNDKEEGYATMAGTPKHPFVDRKTGEVTFWRRWLGFTDISGRYKILQAYDFDGSRYDEHILGGNSGGCYLGLDSYTSTPFAFSIDCEDRKGGEITSVAQLQDVQTAEQLYQDLRHTAGFLDLPQEF